MEREAMDESDIANVLKYTNELPNLQKHYQSLQNNNHVMRCQNQELERDLQVRRMQTAELTEVENMLHQNIDTLQNDIEHLYNERSQLQQGVSRFRNSNGKYLKIKSIAEEIVNRLLTEQESLLDLALKAVEALRRNPDRYAIIYDSKYDSDENASNSSSTTAPILSSSSTYSTYTKRYQNYYYNKCHEGILEIANSFLKILTNQTVDKTMVAAVKGE